MTYNLMNDPNLWVIAGLVFVLGLLIGMFLTAGGRRKWKSRYREEVANRETSEREHARLKQDYDERDKEWRERDSLRGAAVRDSDRARDRDLDSNRDRDRTLDSDRDRARDLESNRDRDRDLDSNRDRVEPRR